MSAIPFDTLKMVNRLVEAGVPTAQAKVQTELMAEVISAEDASIAERFSSKQDVAQELLSIKLALEKLESKFESKFDAIDSKISASAAEVKSELIRWIVSVAVLQMALIAGLVLKLVH